MSFLKIAPNQFLGAKELNWLRLFLDEEGYRALMSSAVKRFGILRTISDPTFTALTISQGTTPVNISISEGLFFDRDLLTGRVPAGEVDVEFTVVSSGLVMTSIPINTPFFVFVEHDYSPREFGTIDIDVSGNLSGTGTLFESVLRGSPHHPVKIEFLNSALNLAEYEVLSVASDTSAILAGGAGVFAAEAGLRYKVIGAFDHGQPVPAGDKDIYQRDFYKLILDDVTAVVPPVGFENKRFLVGTVFTDGVTMTITPLKVEEFSCESHNVIRAEANASAVTGTFNVAYFVARTIILEPFTFLGLNDVFEFEAMFAAQEGTGATVLAKFQLTLGGFPIAIVKTGGVFSNEVELPQTLGVSGYAVKIRVRLVHIGSNTISPIVEVKEYSGYDYTNKNLAGATLVTEQEFVATPIVGLVFSVANNLVVEIKSGEATRQISLLHYSTNILHSKY